MNSHSVMLRPPLPPPNTMRNKPYLQLGRGLAVPFTETMHHLGQPSSASAINQHCHTQMYRLAVPATSGVNRKQHVLISVVILLQKTSESGKGNARIDIRTTALQSIQQAEGVFFFRCENFAPTEWCRPVGVEFRGHCMASWDRMPPEAK